MPQAHVGEILVRQEFEQHRRDARHARFVVGAVPHPAAAPGRFAGAADILDDLRLHEVRQVARTVAVGPALEFALVLTGEEDAQRADDAVAVAHPGVGVERQRHVDRNAQPRGVGQTLRAAHQGIDPMGARHVVVLVVVGVVFRRIDLFRKSRPLKPVARPLAETRVTAGLPGMLRAGQAQRVAGRAGHVAVAAADLHRVGRDDAPARPRTVRKGHDLLPSGGEGKTPEVNPRPAAHRLIDGKRGLAAEVADRIIRVVGAFGRRFVAHINRIFAPLGNVGLPHGTARGPAGHGPHTARRAVAEGIFARMIDLPEVREARAAALPRPLLRILPGVVVVGQHFVFLHVAFARQQHACPGVFEHRNQVRQDIALRIEVLAGLPERRTLPFPAVLRLVEIASVALPQGDMASRKSPSGGLGSRKARHERTPGAVGEKHDLLLIDRFAQLRGVAAGQRNQLGGLAAVGVKFDGGLAELMRQQGAHRVAHGPQVLLAEGIVGQRRRGVDPHPAARGLDGLNAHGDRLRFLVTARYLARNDARKGPADLLPRRGTDFRSGDIT